MCRSCNNPFDPELPYDAVTQRIKREREQQELLTKPDGQVHPGGLNEYTGPSYADGE